MSRTINRANAAAVGTNGTRRENGYLIAPSTLIQEDVYQYPLADGGMSSEFLPNEAITNSVNDWDGQPLYLSHPTDENGIATTSQFGVTSRSTVGQIKNPKANNEKLQAEVWIDLAEVGNHDGELQSAIDTLDAGRTLEVSSGYDARATPETGSHGDSTYSIRHAEIRPDHVAMFPPTSDMTGNCSIDDGCGIGRANNSTNDSTMKNLEAIRHEMHWYGPENISSEKMKAVVQANRRQVATERVVARANEQTKPWEAKLEPDHIDISDERVEEVLRGDYSNVFKSQNMIGAGQHETDRLPETHPADTNRFGETAKANVDEKSDDGQYPRIKTEDPDRFEMSTNE